jgi:hypothetical protein
VSLGKATNPMKDIEAEVLPLGAGAVVFKVVVCALTVIGLG